ncbi:hypothetical protein KU73_00180 [Pectobacterium wasabiae]|uniref:Uncharacterized protein n=2 Tax=Pectobacterium TaxID=122277 RepID=A0ABR4VFX8_9GAMM|nr:hypothetical protein KU73_00180 [Pectobacterium wasabiae]
MLQISLILVMPLAKSIGGDLQPQTMFPISVHALVCLSTSVMAVQAGEDSSSPELGNMAGTANPV